MSAKVLKCGNSLAVRLPKALTEEIDVNCGVFTEMINRFFDNVESGDDAVVAAEKCGLVPLDDTLLDRMDALIGDMNLDVTDLNAPLTQDDLEVNSSHEEMARRWPDKKDLLRKLLEGRWRAENQDAIDVYNARIKRDGVFSHKKKF